MKPRLSYYGELGEMGKERTMKIGDDVKTNEGKVGRILVDEWHDDIRVFTVDVGKGGCRVYLGWQLFPVEPERVWWCPDCEMDSPFQAWHVCEHYRNGMWMQHKPTPSPGLLQRMGMATWADKREWFVMAMPRSEDAGWMLGTLMTNRCGEFESRGIERKGE